MQLEKYAKAGIISGIVLVVFAIALEKLSEEKAPEDLHNFVEEVLKFL